MDLGLRGKIALVTAASKGLGFATARTLVAEGAKVMICGRNQERLDEAVSKLQGEFGTEALVAALVADVSNEDDVSALVSATAATFGGLDILITNAGGPPSGTFDTIDLAQWRQAVDLTLMSAVYLVKEALPHLRQSDAPSILTVTSISVKQPIANLLLSNVIRPAVIGLTKALSQEHGPEGIRANSILPGWTATERVEYLLDSRASVNGTTVEEEASKIGVNVPLRRIGNPQEFANVATFLVSPAASYVNGTMIQVDGGFYNGLI